MPIVQATSWQQLLEIWRTSTLVRYPPKLSSTMIFQSCIFTYSSILKHHDCYYSRLFLSRAGMMSSAPKNARFAIIQHVSHLVNRDYEVRFSTPGFQHLTANSCRQKRASPAAKVSPGVRVCLLLQRMITFCVMLRVVCCAGHVPGLLCAAIH